MLEYNNKTIYNREHKYDNIKFILIFLVVFGHIIENVDKLDILYLIIYSFHMSAFVFVSGYFSKGSKKSIIKSICIYIIFQTLYYFIYKTILHQNTTLNYLQPIWILWYMFALAIWNSLVLIIKQINITKKIYVYLIITFSFLLSLICGYINNIGYFLSLSRIITFCPFFMLGYFCKNNNIKIMNKNEKHKLFQYLTYLIIAIICILYYIYLPNINKKWFYGSYSYEKGGYNIVFRIISHLFSLCIIFLLSNFVSSKKSLISYVGKDTIYIYLFHGMIIKILKSNINNILNTNNVIFGIFIAFIFTIIIIAFIQIIVILIKIVNKKIHKLLAR